MREVNKKYYYRYNGLLKINAGQVIRKNDFAWNSFFELLKLEKQGRLPPFMWKVSPPEYWKDRVLGRRKLIVIVRSDRYYVERVEEDWGYIVLKDYNKKLKYYGRLMWSGKQGDLRDSIRWEELASTHTCGGCEKPPKSNRKGYIEGVREVERRGLMVKRNPESARQREPKGGNKAWIDCGLNNLFAIIDRNRAPRKGWCC